MFACGVSIDLEKAFGVAYYNLLLKQLDIMEFEALQMIGLNPT